MHVHVHHNTCMYMYMYAIMHVVHVAASFTSLSQCSHWNINTHIIYSCTCTYRVHTCACMHVSIRIRMSYINVVHLFYMYCMLLIHVKIVCTVPHVDRGVVVALVLSFTYICLLRWIAGVIIGIGIALCFVLIFASKSILCT